VSADASTIDHEAAASIARGLGSTYTSPSDDAVKLVFKAYLAMTDELAAAKDDVAAQLSRLRDANRSTDAAKADAARLREALKAASCAVYPVTDKGNAADALRDAALSATDSGAWLQARERDVAEKTRDMCAARLVEFVEVEVKMDDGTTEVEDRELTLEEQAEFIRNLDLDDALRGGA